MREGRGWRSGGCRLWRLYFMNMNMHFAVRWDKIISFLSHNYVHLIAYTSCLLFLHLCIPHRPFLIDSKLADVVCLLLERPQLEHTASCCLRGFQDPYDGVHLKLIVFDLTCAHSFFPGLPLPHAFPPPSAIRLPVDHFLAHLLYEVMQMAEKKGSKAQ